MATTPRRPREGTARLSPLVALLTLGLLAAAGGTRAQGIRVSHLAGPVAGGPGAIDGTGPGAAFNLPNAVALDAQGNAYVADTLNHTIRKVTPAGVVTTFAGTRGVPGAVDGAGPEAQFNNPMGIALDASGTVYLADTNSHTIRRITSSGTVSTLAGLAGVPGADDQTGSAARFRFPAGISVDAAGSVAFVADAGNHTIRRLDLASLAVTTVAGSALSSGTADGDGSIARFNTPSAVALSAGGTAVYVADTNNHTIRRIDVGTATVSTLAGLAGSPGGANGTGTAARFNQPYGVAIDGHDLLYVADAGTSAIRAVTAVGVVTTMAGWLNIRGSQDGTGASARFYAPHGVAANPGGTLIVVADTSNCTVRTVTAAGVVTTLAGTAAQSGSADGVGSAARFVSPNGVTVDVNGIVYVADTINSTIRRIEGQTVTTVAGLPGHTGSNNGTGSEARFWAPRGLAAHPNGNVYVADTYNDAIRQVTPGGVVTLLAGSPGTSGTRDGTGTEARFYRPYAIAVDPVTGDLFVADTRNYTIRRVTLQGAVTTFAGLANNPGSADGTGSSARFRAPYGIAVDASSHVYVADTDNHTVRKITPGGVVTTVAGSAGLAGSSDGTGAGARFRTPYGIAVDEGGRNIYVSDFGNHTIRQIRIDPYHLGAGEAVVTTLAGQASVPGNVDGIGRRALFNGMWGIALRGGRIYGADVNSSDIRVLTRYNAADADGDGVTDILVYRPSTGTWFALQSEDQWTETGYVGWGLPTDVPAMGDYWGDGEVTAAVYRPSTGTWFVARLGEGPGVLGWAWWGWGGATDTLVQGDYDGDGITDAAVYRPSTGEWFIRPSAHMSWTVTFGQPGDTPVPGDYDGDGQTDIAVYRPPTGTWFILKSSSAFTAWTYIGWGMEAHGDTPVPGDYDGDGQTDCTVYRPAAGTWFVLQSSTNNTGWTWFGWGAPADTPVPGDYDGDAITDVAVYRPSNGTWFVRPSSGATPWSVVFGQAGDVPLSSIR